MGAYVFQDLCRDLLAAEDEIATCDVYGVQGERQLGIDLLAYRHRGGGTEVGQCKAYAAFTPAQIKRASDEFLKHWDQVWSKRDVKRFILFVGCSLDQTNRFDAIEVERRRFAELGIVYEVWSAATIRHKLRPWPGIVMTYFKHPEIWVPEICGPALPSASSLVQTEPRHGAVSALLENSLEQLRVRLSGEIGRQLDEVRERWREGRRQAATDWVEGLRRDRDTWAVLTADVRARLLRLQARLQLDQGGSVQQAKQLASEAADLAPDEDDEILRTLIIFKESGPSEALALLAGGSSIARMNLRAALLISLEDFEGARVALLGAVDQVHANAESYRLQALIEFASGDIDRARLALQRALEAAPRWTSVRHLAAVINYYSALAVPAVPRRLTEWPEPVDWILVRRDDQSLDRLRRAADLFRELVAEAEDPRERQELEAWLLACLANDPAAQESAAQCCRDLIMADAENYRLMLWATARSMPVDLRATEAAIEAAVGNSTAELGAVVTLATRYLITRRHDRADSLLARAKALFLGQGAAKLWDVLEAQARPPRTGRIVQATASESPTDRVSKLASLRAAVRKRGGWKRLAAYLRMSYEATGRVEYLLERCQILQQQGDWPSLAEHADELVDLLATADAVRLAAMATFNVGDPSRCLAILDEHRDAFPHHSLPLQLRRLRAQALRACGRLLEVVAEAEAIAREDAATEHLFHLAELHLAKGDLLSLVLVARRLLDRPDLSQQGALWLAARVRVPNPELARRLWEKVAAGDVPDHLVTSLVDLAYQLNLEREGAPLVQRMQRLGVTGGADVRTASTAELITMVHKARENAQQALDAYRRGDIPIHFLAPAVGRPLSFFYYRLPVQHRAAPDPHHQDALYYRHGQRSRLQEEPLRKPPGKLYLDVTALMSAAQAGILDAAETAFGPLQIAEALVLALVDMQERTAHHQPARLDACREVLRLSNGGVCAVLNVDAPHAPSDVDPRAAAETGNGDEPAMTGNPDALIVEFAQPEVARDDRSPGAPDGAARSVINCRTVVDALRAEGAISTQDYGRAVDALGTEARQLEGVPLPARGARLHCRVGIATTLATAGVLDRACAIFRMCIDRQEIGHCRAEADEADASLSENRWLGQLIERISRGIEMGRYQIVPAPRINPEEATQVGREDLVTQSLLTLVASDLSEEDALWVDDRYTNGFLRSGSAMIVETTEVVRWLVDAGTIDQQTGDDVLAGFRAANVRFAPLHPGEIVRRLTEAVTRDGGVVDTSELRILRQYLASCFLQADVLRRAQRSPTGTPSLGEVAYLLEALRSVDTAIISLWREPDGDPELIERRAEWLLSNLHTDRHVVAAIFAPDRPDVDDRHLAASGLVSLIINANGLPPDGDVPARRRYFEWLDARILRNRFEVEPELLPMVADQFRSLVIALLDDDTGGAVLGMTIAGTMQALYDDLPAQLRRELQQDPGFMARIGLTFAELVEVAPWRFEAELFWRTAAEARNGRPSAITPLDQEREVTLSPWDGAGTRGIEILDPASGQTKFIGETLVDLLSELVHEREAALRSARHWFDCSNEQFVREITRIAGLEDPIARVREAGRWRDASAEVFYRRLKDEVQRERAVRRGELLPPDGEALLRHFRLSNGPSMGAEVFVKRWEECAAGLLTDEGLQEALLRCMAIPVPLPEILVTAVADLPRESRRALLKQLVQAPGSPVSAVHLAHLLLRIDEPQSASHRLARRILKLLATPPCESVDAFVSLLQWSNVAVSRWTGARSWSPEVRLAMVWAHGHRLYATLAAAQVPVAWIREAFGDPLQTIQLSLSEYGSESRHDIANPKRLSRAELLLHGIAYAVGQQTGVVDDQLQALLVDLAGLENESGRHVSPDVLLDTTLASNLVGTFLGGPRDAQFAVLFDDEIAQLVAPDRLRGAVQQVLPSLSADDDVVRRASWIILAQVLSDLPPPADLAEPLTEALGSTDFAALVRREVQSGLFAVKFAASAAGILGYAGLRGHYEDQLIGVARYLADRATREERDDHDSETEVSIALLVESVLTLALSSAQTLTEAIEQITTLLDRIVDVWPASAPKVSAALRYLCEELPSTATHRLWTSLLKLQTR